MPDLPTDIDRGQFRVPLDDLLEPLPIKYLLWYLTYAENYQNHSRIAELVDMAVASCSMESSEIYGRLISEFSSDINRGSQFLIDNPRLSWDLFYATEYVRKMGARKVAQDIEFARKGV